MSDTYWGSNGAHQKLADKLEAMVPAEGSVLHPKKNKALEKYRVACNCYYDLYNNGLCNRAQQFNRVFGISSFQYRYRTRYSYEFSEHLYQHVEAKMNEIVMAAAVEQGLLTK